MNSKILPLDLERAKVDALLTALRDRDERIASLEADIVGYRDTLLATIHALRKVTLERDSTRQALRSMRQLRSLPINGSERVSFRKKRSDDTATESPWTM